MGGLVVAIPPLPGKRSTNMVLMRRSTERGTCPEVCIVVTLAEYHFVGCVTDAVYHHYPTWPDVLGSA